MGNVGSNTAQSSPTLKQKGCHCHPCLWFACRRIISMLHPCLGRHWTWLSLLVCLCPSVACQVVDLLHCMNLSCCRCHKFCSYIRETIDTKGLATVAVVSAVGFSTRTHSCLEWLCEGKTGCTHGCHTCLSCFFFLKLWSSHLDNV